jgi:hypothetical protein
MLQRIDPDGVGDRIVVQRAVRAVGPVHEFVAVTKKVVVIPRCSSLAPEKSPNIVAADAGCMANAW